MTVFCSPATDLDLLPEVELNSSRTLKKESCCLFSPFVQISQA